MGPLTGFTVVELASEATAFAGKLLGDMGARVVLVEPPGGSPLRSWEPFLDDVAGADRSLWWWSYQTSKAGVTADLDTEAGRERFRALAGAADAVLEAEPVGRLSTLRIDSTSIRRERPALTWVSLTSHGPEDARSAQPSTDLTILSEAGPVWSCGYDDHSLPPVRGGGGQAAHTAAHWAVMSLLVALVHRDRPGSQGRGQHISVSSYAASNVTTEFATYGWLVAGQTAQRQTGRHAAPKPSLPTQAPCADGRFVNTGVPPRSGKEFRLLIAWLEEMGLDEEFDEIGVLRLGTDLGKVGVFEITEDPLVGEIFQAGRNAQFFIASKLTAYEFFVGSQQRGMPAGAVYSPEEVLTDPHVLARRWPVEIDHPDLGRTVDYPGGGIRFTATPTGPRRRAPSFGEHDDEVFAADGTVRIPPVDPVPGR